MSTDDEFLEEVFERGGSALWSASNLAEQSLPHHLDELARCITEEIEEMRAEDHGMFVRAILRAFSRSFLVSHMTEAGLGPAAEVNGKPLAGPAALINASRFLDQQGRKQWGSVKRTVERLEGQLREIYVRELPPEYEQLLSKLKDDAEKFSERRASGNYPTNSGFLIRTIWPILKARGINQSPASSIIADAFVRQGLAEEREGLTESVRQSIHYSEC